MSMAVLQIWNKSAFIFSNPFGANKTKYKIGIGNETDLKAEKKVPIAQLMKMNHACAGSYDSDLINELIK